MYEGSSFSTSSATPVIVSRVDYNHPSVYELVCHWVLVCISLVTNDMVIGHLKISSGEISFEVICPFENSVIYVLIVELQVLNILDTSSLSDM